MKRHWIIAALVATAALAYAGSSEASAANPSPPAPLRVAASPRHSAAGASATATHATRSRHARRHHRRHAAVAEQLIARNPMTAAGGSPPQPARRSTVPRHAAIRPPSHEYRPHARGKTGGHGPAEDRTARLSNSWTSGRFDPGTDTDPVSHIELVSRGRGPPEGRPHHDASSSPRQHFSGTSPPTHNSNTTRTSRSDPGRTLPYGLTLTRDRLPSRPHADRQEGAVACFGMPSTRRPS